MCLGQVHKLRLVLTMHLTHHWKVWESYPYGLQGVEVQLGSPGCVHGLACLFQWGLVRLIIPWDGKAGGGSGLCLGTRTNPSACVSSPGSRVISSVRAVTLISGFMWGISDGDLPSKVGATGAFSATSGILRSRRSPLWIMEARHFHSSCTAPQRSPGSIPEWTSHLCRALAKATVSSALTTQ